MPLKTYFTSESVSPGHPDKVADRISDAIVTYCLTRDPKARVAAEAMVKDNTVVLGGEVTTTVDIPYEALVREAIVSIGYDDPELGFNGHDCKIINLIGQQSPDINQGVDREDGELGAGDQGIMFGIACNETKVRAPLAITMAHDLLRRLNDLRLSGWKDKALRPDAKSQVTVKYEDGKIVGIDTIVISTQHAPEIEQSVLREQIIEDVVIPILTAHGYSTDKHFPVDHLATEPQVVIDGAAIVKVLINPTGKFVIGGPVGDCGLTGRKLIVDTTGGYGRMGGGAMSGKDPSKVDRSAAYAARWAAKNIVAAGLADKAEIQLSYAIGYAKPTSILVDTFGTEKDGVTASKIAEAVSKVFDFSPAGIIRDLDLLNQDGWLYEDTAAFGHFGRDDVDLPWEREDKVDDLLNALEQINK